MYFSWRFSLLVHINVLLYLKYLRTKMSYELISLINSARQSCFLIVTVISMFLFHLLFPFQLNLFTKISSYC